MTLTITKQETLKSEAPERCLDSCPVVDRDEARSRAPELEKRVAALMAEFGVADYQYLAVFQTAEMTDDGEKTTMAGCVSQKVSARPRFMIPLMSKCLAHYAAAHEPFPGAGLILIGGEVAEAYDDIISEKLKSLDAEHECCDADEKCDDRPACGAAAEAASEVAAES